MYYYIIIIVCSLFFICMYSIMTVYKYFHGIARNIIRITLDNDDNDSNGTNNNGYNIVKPRHHHHNDNGDGNSNIQLCIDMNDKRILLLQLEPSAEDKLMRTGKYIDICEEIFFFIYDTYMYLNSHNNNMENNTSVGGNKKMMMLMHTFITNYIMFRKPIIGKR